jgi:hypothetical protein
MSDNIPTTNVTLAEGTEKMKKECLAYMKKTGLRFHDDDHVREVIQSTEKIGNKLREHKIFNERLFYLAIMVAAAHDLIQRFAIVQQGIMIAKGKFVFVRRRQRFAGDNEMDSFEVFWGLIRKYFGDQFFTYEERKLALDAFLATIPNGWDAPNSTVEQKNLLPESHWLIRTIALADLSGAGMHSGTFPRQGSALYEEDNPWVKEAVEGKYFREKLEIYNGKDAATAEKTGETITYQDAFLLHNTAWDLDQEKWVVGREKRLELELGTNGPEEVRQAVRGLFTGFAESAKSSKAYASVSPKDVATRYARLFLPIDYPVVAEAQPVEGSNGRAEAGKTHYPAAAPTGIKA